MKMSKVYTIYKDLFSEKEINFMIGLINSSLENMLDITNEDDNLMFYFLENIKRKLNNLIEISSNIIFNDHELYTLKNYIDEYNYDITNFSLDKLQLNVKLAKLRLSDYI